MVSIRGQRLAGVDETLGSGKACINRQDMGRLAVYAVLTAFCVFV